MRLLTKKQHEERKKSLKKYKKDFGRGNPKDVIKFLREEGYNSLAKALFTAYKHNKSNQ